MNIKIVQFIWLLTLSFESNHCGRNFFISAEKSSDATDMEMYSSDISESTGHGLNGGDTFGILGSETLVVSDFTDELVQSNFATESVFEPAAAQWRQHPSKAAKDFEHVARPAMNDILFLKTMAGVGARPLYTNKPNSFRSSGSSNSEKQIKNHKSSRKSSSRSRCQGQSTASRRNAGCRSIKGKGGFCYEPKYFEDYFREKLYHYKNDLRFEQEDEQVDAGNAEEEGEEDNFCYSDENASGYGDYYDYYANLARNSGALLEERIRWALTAISLSLLSWFPVWFIWRKLVASQVRRRMLRRSWKYWVALFAYRWIFLFWKMFILKYYWFPIVWVRDTFLEYTEWFQRKFGLDARNTESKSESTKSGKAQVEVCNNRKVGISFNSSASSARNRSKATSSGKPKNTHLNGGAKNSLYVVLEKEATESEIAELKLEDRQNYSNNSNNNSSNNGSNNSNKNSNDNSKKSSNSFNDESLTYIGRVENSSCDSVGCFDDESCFESSESVTTSNESLPEKGTKAVTQGDVIRSSPSKSDRTKPIVGQNIKSLSIMENDTIGNGHMIISDPRKEINTKYDDDDNDPLKTKTPPATWYSPFHSGLAVNLSLEEERNSCPYGGIIDSEKDDLVFHPKPARKIDTSSISVTHEMNHQMTPVNRINRMSEPPMRPSPSPISPTISDGFIPPLMYDAEDYMHQIHQLRKLKRNEERNEEQFQRENLNYQLKSQLYQSKQLYQNDQLYQSKQLYQNDQLYQSNPLYQSKQHQPNDQLHQSNQLHQNDQNQLKVIKTLNQQLNRQTPVFNCNEDLNHLSKVQVDHRPFINYTQMTNQNGSFSDPMLNAYNGDHPYINLTSPAVYYSQQELELILAKQKQLLEYEHLQRQQNEQFERMKQFEQFEKFNRMNQMNQVNQVNQVNHQVNHQLNQVNHQVNQNHNLNQFSSNSSTNRMLYDFSTGDVIVLEENDSVSSGSGNLQRFSRFGSFHGR